MVGEWSGNASVHYHPHNFARLEVNLIMRQALKWFYLAAFFAGVLSALLRRLRRQ
jgi:hypothetical protein